MVPHLRLATARVLAIKRARRVGPLGCGPPGWLGLKRCSRWRRRAQGRLRAHAQTSGRFVARFSRQAQPEPRLGRARQGLPRVAFGRRRFRVQSCASVYRRSVPLPALLLPVGRPRLRGTLRIELPAHIDADIPLDVSLDDTVIAF